MCRYFWAAEMTPLRNALLVLPLTIGFAAASMVQKQDEDALAAKVAKANAEWANQRQEASKRANAEWVHHRRGSTRRMFGRPRRMGAVKAVAKALLCQDHVAGSKAAASMAEIPSGTSAFQVKLEDSLATKQSKPLGHASMSDAALASLCGSKSSGGQKFSAGHQSAGNPEEQSTSTKHNGWYPNEEDEYYVPYEGHEEEAEQYYYEAAPSSGDHWNMEQQGRDKVPPNVMTMAQNPRRTDTEMCNPTGYGAQLLIRCCSYNVRELIVPMESVATKQVTFEEALHKCEAAGYRLCTINEVKDGRACAHDGCGSGDSTDDPNPPGVWTSTPCEQVAEGADQWHGPTVPPPEGHLTEKQLRMFMDGLKKKQAELTKNLHELVHNHEKLQASSMKLPFEVNKVKRTVELNDWNLWVYSSSRQPGTGNLLVGLGNSARKADNSVVFGDSNVADGESVTVAGGWNNIAKGHFSSILGGKDNTVDAGYAAVVGGVNNTAERDGVVISGGSGNIGNGEAAVVSGGFENVANGAFSQVGGGFKNTATGESATVGGGTRNMASGQAATVTSGSDQVASGEQYR